MKSCEVIGGGRMCGKTVALIKRASEENLYILCANKHMAKLIFNQAQDMGLDIPFPITPDDLPIRGYMDKVLIDEVEQVLRQLIGKHIAGMSTSYELKKLPSLRKEQQESNPLLSIELKDESSVPVVRYKGEEIKHLKELSMDWETDKDEYGGLTYAIEHQETGNKQPTTNRIERRVKGHAI